jgi:N-acetyl-gamma-glutamyl-phosphate reductase
VYDLRVISVGIVGASGFTGAELLRICARHPDLSVQFATGDTQAGSAVADLYPSLAAHYRHLRFASYDPVAVDGLDVVFLGLPHGASQALVPDLRGRVKHVVDLAADFRLKEPALYPAWYGEEHHAPELLAQFAYGLPELFRPTLIGAPAIAVPGCYPTSASLALAPLLRTGSAHPTGIIVDAASGVSGAGRAPKPNTAFCTVDEDFTAYGLLSHRHTPEIEQALSTAADGTPTQPVQVLFTPHLAPMNRGILATCYSRPTGSTSTEALLDLYRDFYAGEQFVVVDPRSPSTKATLGSNAAHLTVRYDGRTGWIVSIAAIDNLNKGASGQAVQCANVALGLDEASGLESIGVYP